MGGPGVELRLEILKKSADQQILKPLHTHGWSAIIESEHADGEYLIISATKSEVIHKVALMYTSATDNKYFRNLDKEVEQIYTNGALYMVESFAYGITTPVSPIDEFFPTLVAWNKQVTPSKLTFKEIKQKRAAKRITSERPIDGVWAHLSQLGSVKLAEKLIRERASGAAIELNTETIGTKAYGLAYSIRNAIDYFSITPNESINKRILSLYYGTLALAFSEMLAAPHGPTDLDEVEGMTKQGHGLFTVPPISDEFEKFNVGILATGFFSRWMAFLGYDTTNYPKAKPKSPSDLERLPSGTTTTIGQLFSTLPELGDLFQKVCDIAPSWVDIVFDMEANGRQYNLANLECSYVLLIDRSGLINKDRLKNTQWPITEICDAPNDQYGGNFYHARVDHPNREFWYQALSLHHSPFKTGSTLILPSIGGITEYRAISTMILYSLSILVRYMPSAWRRVEGGDWDQHLTLIRTTLDVLERMLPQEFLESITDENVYSNLPGHF
jgi:hypothetical protein